MTKREEATSALEKLEAFWLALLSWLADSEQITQEQLVGDWNAEKLTTATARRAQETKSAKRPPDYWALLQFVDLGDYSHLAARYSDRLEKLGQPAPTWKALLEQHNQRGLARNRNNVQHTRFHRLSPVEQQEIIDLFREQHSLLMSWWKPPAKKYEARPPEDAMRTAVKLLGADPENSRALVEELGMVWQPALTNYVNKDLDSYFDGVYRTGEASLGSGVNVAMFIAVVREWPLRSAERERLRRRVARSTTERFQKDRRQLILMVDGQGKAEDAEIVVPRVREGSGFGTIRAAIRIRDPSRHHVDTLKELRIQPGWTLADVSREWSKALAVESVTKRFYEEFQSLRERLIVALLEHNPKNPALTDSKGKQKDRTKDKEFAADLNAFATRQLCRVLFLWFIQQKRWLGGSPKNGETDFLLRVFREFKGGDSFFADALLPICFVGLGRKPNERKKWLELAPTKLDETKHERLQARLIELPFLGGGLFTPGADAFEELLFGVDSDSREVTTRVSLPDDLFDPLKDDREGGKNRERTVLGLLDSYRFTTQESTPDDQSLDPDPELLGKVFENLYQAKDRKDTGAYYTPREIVQYMCRQTLDAYLRDTAEVSQDVIDGLREEAVDWAVATVELSGMQESALTEALNNVRIVDPAVGSGAFPLMMMHEIVTLRRGIEQCVTEQDVPATSPKVSFWKRQVAENNLYGVDINPMAVEICRLRLWLSVVVDLDVTAFSQIEPLPDLELKIVCGDSLIDRAGEDRFIESLPQPTNQQMTLMPQYVTDDGSAKKSKKANATAHEQLNGLIAQYRGGEGAPSAKAKLRTRIADLQIDIMVAQLDHMRAERASVVEDMRNPHLLKKKPAKAAVAAQEAQLAAFVDMKESLLRHKQFRTGVQKPFLWPLNFLDVFEKNGGFDIVVANPPYVRMEGIANADEKAYSVAFREVAAPRADLLVYFYGRALQVLREGGQLAFITSNSFVKRAYGLPLRKHLATQLSLLIALDFGEISMSPSSISSRPARCASRIGTVLRPRNQRVRPQRLHQRRVQGCAAPRSSTPGRPCPPAQDCRHERRSLAPTRPFVQCGQSR